MNDKDSGFKSYIDENEEFQSITLNESQKTKLLDGETLVFEAQKVTMCVPLSNPRREIPGVLTVTTFKLSFVSAEDDSDNSCYQQNFLLGCNDVCLSSIDTVYQLTDRTKKKLQPGQSITGKIKDLLIVCKNMKCFEFSFKQGDKDNGKNIANAILHHAFPKRHSLLFAYEYRELYHKSYMVKEVREFLHASDWKFELDRTKCKNWRVSHVNNNYQTIPELNEVLIVPSSVNDAILKKAVGHFRQGYCPVWVWGTAKGAALIRMADLLPTITERTQENILLEHIRKSHPEKRAPHLMDLNAPSTRDIQNSYLKLRELCIPNSVRLFKNQDYKFYALLDSTKWLNNVSICLTKAYEAARLIKEENRTIVLQEGNGQDLNCVISSLIQIISDPYFRTVNGFQSLIQKDWISMGHPFAYRLGHILNKDIEPSPLLLLFLDAVWQLVKQFNYAFEITETYLTTVWDSAHISVFDTFLFNSIHDRLTASTHSTLGDTSLILRSVWDWREQFNEKDICLFYNPLFTEYRSKETLLEPHCGLAGLDIWSQCYFRWIPDLEIRNGGNPQIDLTVRLIVSDIKYLREKEHNGKYVNDKESRVELMQKINSFYPFSHNRGQMNDILPLSNVLLTGDMDNQSILNLNSE